MNRSFFNAITNGQESRVREFLLKYPELAFSRRDDNGRTPLHEAVSTAFTYLTDAESMAIAELLLSKGVDVNAKDDFGDTPLHSAARYSSMNIAELLIARGADINAQDSHRDYGLTPFHRAAEGGRIDVMELLLSKGVDVNARDNQGSTPLHWVSGKQGYRDVVEFLLANGADVNAKDNSGRTPLHWASINERIDVVELLRKHDGYE